MELFFFIQYINLVKATPSIICALSIRVEEPVFESQTKTKLGSLEMAPNGKTIKTFTNEFLKSKLDDYLHKNPDVAKMLLDRILESENMSRTM